MSFVFRKCVVGGVGDKPVREENPIGVSIKYEGTWSYQLDEVIDDTYGLKWKKESKRTRISFFSPFSKSAHLFLSLSLLLICHRVLSLCRSFSTQESDMTVYWVVMNRLFNPLAMSDICSEDSIARIVCF